jgi:transcription elongation GreA/GreB family factor
MERKQIFTQLEEEIKKEVKSFEDARDEAQEEANNHVGAMESRYDTFKEEAQYLVSAHESRIAQLSTDLANLKLFLSKMNSIVYSTTIQFGSIVITEMANKQKNHYFFSPVGGGRKLTIEGTTMMVITPTSPLGKSLHKRKKGEQIVTTIGGKELNQKIMEVL